MRWFKSTCRLHLRHEGFKNCELSPACGFQIHGTYNTDSNRTLKYWMSFIWYETPWYKNMLQWWPIASLELTSQV